LLIFDEVTDKTMLAPFFLSLTMYMYILSLSWHVWLYFTVCFVFI